MDLSICNIGSCPQYIMSIIEYQYQVLNITVVIEITALSRSTIYALINPKSDYNDPSFSKPIHLTKNRIGWLSQEINDWLELKIAQREE